MLIGKLINLQTILNRSDSVQDKLMDGWWRRRHGSLIRCTVCGETLLWTRNAKWKYSLKWTIEWKLKRNPLQTEKCCTNTIWMLPEPILIPNDIQKRKTWNTSKELCGLVSSDDSVYNIKLIKQIKNEMTCANFSIEKHVFSKKADEIKVRLQSRKCLLLPFLLLWSIFLWFP